MKILTAEMVRNVEKRAEKMGMTGERLMENAGSAAAKKIAEICEVSGKNVTVVTGLGNNGGDGFVVARKLKDYGANVTVVMAFPLTGTKSSTGMLKRAKEVGVNIFYYYDDTEFAVKSILAADIVVDAIFGIGFRGAVEGEVATIINIMNSSSGVKFALDLPSGVLADTGEVMGAVFKADYTVTFISLKPCHFLFPGAEYSGKTLPVYIGVDLVPADGFLAEVCSEKSALEDLVKISKNANKGSKGMASILAGSYGMAGAAAIATRSAVRSGAGIVKTSLPEKIYSIVASNVLEAVYNPLKDCGDCITKGALNNNILDKADALLIGPGLSNNSHTSGAVFDILSRVKVPTVIDADALNVIGEDVDFLKRIKAPVIVTPHPGEMARLCKKSVLEVENDRINIAKQFAENYCVITVLKGAYTVIAEPGGRVFVNFTGNEGMATAGSGDMLAGMLVGFLANGMSPIKATLSAVTLHGTAGDRVASRLGVRGMTVSDMIEELPLVFKK